jgi:2-oxoglutarate dehydrogenase E1 component
MPTLNFAYENELYFQYLKNPESVSPEWRIFFETNQNTFREEGEISTLTHPMTKESLDERFTEQTDGLTHPMTKKTSDENPVPHAGNGYSDKHSQIEGAEPLSSIATIIAGNMQESLSIPTATSFRVMPVKALEENRRIINKYLVKQKHQRVSFTHILAWAVIKALIKFPQMNSYFQEIDGKPFRVRHDAINLGMAVDVQKKDGSRYLYVPNVKNSQSMTFLEFITAIDDVIGKVRSGKPDIKDLEGTTVTITNPGNLGTTASSPRLMKGQGLIIATGAIEYPPEFQAVQPEVLATFAVSKILNVTSTYDHRIIQGAESAEFLSYLSKLLTCEDQFYRDIFKNLNIPFEPVAWGSDNIRTQNGVIEMRSLVEKGAHAMQLINAFRVRGHLLADDNPLGFTTNYFMELDPAYWGFTIWDMDRIFHADDTWEKNELPLRDIIELLRQTYCGSTGYEFMHIQDPDKKDWIKRKLEHSNFPIISDEDKKFILRELAKTVEFENFLHTKFLGHKRFSLEGGESMIVMLHRLLALSADSGIKDVVMGMPHRGRLDVLANIFSKKLDTIFSEFDGDIDPVSYQGSGDVKYHLGARGTYKTRNDKEISIVMSSNPSHLELVNPVVEGMARAIDDQLKDETYSTVLPVLIHGDSAFAGQGIVAETLNLSNLEGYKTGGTIHIIVNNQIGFTTNTEDARSTVYASDVAKMIQVPILHVNGNDPEAVWQAAEFAFSYRNAFHNDVIIDMLCYRKYGHNEADEPSYTQPLMYKKIHSMKSVAEIYDKQLVDEKVVLVDDYTNYIRPLQREFYDVFNNRQQKPVIISNDKPSENIFEEVKTGISEEDFNIIVNSIDKLPENFVPHPKVKTLLNRRMNMINSEKPDIDWSIAEIFAMGSILKSGMDIRFSGQDSPRGTFSQRHAILTDYENEDIYVPLNHISVGQGQLRMYSSPLSELAILGYEYGYSTEGDNHLTFWEAQFGDFGNMAQPIVDQFIACAESKWGIHSNIILLLPHGYEGQGSEHSSARIERFLQECAENNMLICNLSTPAQYFHAIRRQVVSKLKKPLIIFTPKSLLRHPLAVSGREDFLKGSFHEILDDINVENPISIKRVILCSGKIYYDLLAELKKVDSIDTALIRIEQLYPLHLELLEKILSKYKKTEKFYWVQEEPKNMGAYSFIESRIRHLLPKNSELIYIGRKENPASATGSLNIHNAEQEEILKLVQSV